MCWGTGGKLNKVKSLGESIVLILCLEDVCMYRCSGRCRISLRGVVDWKYFRSFETSTPF